MTCRIETQHLQQVPYAPSLKLTELVTRIAEPLHHSEIKCYFKICFGRRLEPQDTTLERMDAPTNYASQGELNDDFNDAWSRLSTFKSSTNMWLLILLEVAIEGAPTPSDEMKSGSKRKSRSDEGEDSPQNNASASSEMGASRSLRNQQRRRALVVGGPSSANAQNEDAKIEFVHGYRVKARSAIVLRSIFAKYGNIASDTVFNIFPEFNAPLLEMVADVVIKILRYDLDYVLSEFSSIMGLVEIAVMGQVDVSWLDSYLAEIEELREFVLKAATKDFDAKKKVMMEAKKRFKKVQISLGEIVGTGVYRI